MENLKIALGVDEAFDELVHAPGHLADVENSVRIATKDDATITGKPGVVIAFDVRMPDGSFARAQTVITVALLATVFSALRGRYGPGGPEAARFGDNNPFI